MKIPGRVVAVTGGGAGIGRALCERFAQEGARAVIVIDKDHSAARETAAACGGVAYKADVSSQRQLMHAIDAAEARVGPIEIFCSNAGVATSDPDPSDPTSAPDALWQRDWSINVMAHVRIARLLVPRMIARGEGYVLITVSAAGLLSQIGSAAYSTTKHAAVGFAEALAIAHRHQGLKVSILCPQAVDTAMLRDSRNNPADVDGVLTPREVADAALRGVEAECFLILPHPKVGEYMRRKCDDYDRWLGGMARLRDRIIR